MTQKNAAYFRDPYVREQAASYANTEGFARTKKQVCIDAEGIWDAWLLFTNTYRSVYFSKNIKQGFWRSMGKTLLSGDPESLDQALLVIKELGGLGKDMMSPESISQRDFAFFTVILPDMVNALERIYDCVCVMDGAHEADFAKKLIRCQKYLLTLIPEALKHKGEEEKNIIKKCECDLHFGIYQTSYLLPAEEGARRRETLVPFFFHKPICLQQAARLTR